MFSITGIEGDTIESYTGASSLDAEHGNAWFAAHVADFSTGEVWVGLITVTRCPGWMHGNQKRLVWWG